MICSSWPVPSVATANGLGLAAGEQRRAVRARQDADLGRDRPHRRGVAAVDAAAAAQDRAAHDVLFELLEQLERQRALPRRRRRARRPAPWRRRAGCCAPACPARDRPHRSAARPSRAAGSRSRRARRRPPAGPTAPCAQVSASSMIAWITGWKLAMAEHHRAEHDVLGQLLAPPIRPSARPRRCRRRRGRAASAAARSGSGSARIAPSI